MNAHDIMNWEAERDMARDVEENKEMYEALADSEAECQLCDTNVERGRAFALGYFLGLNVDTGDTSLF